jgi:hypothetical protein
MKKVILLIMSALLIVALAVPAMADVSWGGRILGSMVTGFAPKEGKAANSYYYLYAGLTADVDEYNTLYFEFGGYGNTGMPWTVDGAYIETDLGAYFGLPVGLVSTFGNFWACTRKYEATGHATERVGRQCYQLNGVKANLDFGMGDITVLTSIGDDFDPLTTPNIEPIQAVIVTLPELGPVDLEAFMYGNAQEEFKPIIGVNAKVAFDPVSVAAGFAFDLAKGAHLAGTQEWAFGVGAKADLGMFAAGAAVNGNSDDALNSVTLEAGAEVMENVGVDVGVGLSLAEGADTFQGAEISAYVSPGASTWRIGYIITTTAEYAYQSVVSQPDGGLFVQGDLSF